MHQTLCFSCQSLQRGIEESSCSTSWCTFLIGRYRSVLQHVHQKQVLLYASSLSRAYEQCDDQLQHRNLRDYAIIPWTSQQSGIRSLGWLFLSNSVWHFVSYRVMSSLCQETTAQTLLGRRISLYRIWRNGACLTRWIGNAWLVRKVQRTGQVKEPERSCGHLSHLQCKWDSGQESQKPGYYLD